MKKQNNTTHAISFLFYDSFYLQAKVSPPNIALGEISHPKMGSQKECPGGKVEKN